MAFNSNDLYTLSGGVTLFNYWNPFVTKHDTSSFYNWEQDNLPLYDLEERTYYLWEKFGYPLSAVPSMALVVSSSIPSTLGSSSNVFTSIEDALESLPEIIRMPTLIEIAVSGNIGSINLNNIKCEDDGALEIINRGFAPLAEWSEISGVGNATNYISLYESTGADSNNDIPDTFSGVGPIAFYNNSSALSISANTGGLFPAATEAGFFRNLSFATTQCSSVDTNPSKTGYGFVGGGNLTAFLDADGITLQMAAVSDDTIGKFDVSTYDTANAEFLKRPTPIDHDQLMNGIITANRVSQIRVENCDGPIYVRGFIVDGYDDVESAYETAVGIGVYNSNNVSIEDCGSMRCTSAGYEINNSKVKLRRRNIAARNYDTEYRGLDYYETYGFKISNSEVEYKTDTEYAVGTAACLASFFHTYGVHLSNSKLYGGDLGEGLPSTGSVTNTTLREVTPFEIGYNNYGLYADSSEYDIKGISDIYNNQINIKANNSEIRTGRFMIDYANTEGIDFSNSRFIINTDFEKRLGSTAAAIYNSSEDMPYSRLGSFTKNNRHILLNNGSYYGPDYPVDVSSFTPGETSSLCSRYNTIEYNYSFGEDYKSNPSLLPSISINKSRAVMPATLLRTNNTNGGTSFVKGMGIQVNDEGVCKLIGFAPGSSPGSSEFNDFGTTYIKGGTSFLGQQKSSGLAATNNSTIYITGPTAIVQFGVGILADNNSVIKACPVLGDDDSSYDGSGWGRMQRATNTCLEIHATRACAVASNNSQLRFEDLGYFTNYWSTPAASAADYNPLGLDNSAIASGLCAAGALQFYPNPVDGDVAISDFDGAQFNSADPGPTPISTAFDSTLSCLRVLYTESYSDTNIASDIRDQASRGGVCVRVTGDSEVFVRNVHFPTGFNNTDASFFDPSSSLAGCNDLYIWNVQDTSRINASYATVSGVYPSLAGYTGPRSTYTLLGTSYGLGDDTSTVPYGAFSGTPDTGYVSVLDHFGSGVSLSVLGSLTSPLMSSIQISRTGDANTYGPDSYENRGPFRLYFPVNPEVRALSYAGSGPEDTRPYQHLAQGYALSGAVSATNDLSGIFQELLTIINEDLPSAGSGVGASMSGYYYPDAVRLNLTRMGWGVPDFSSVDFVTHPLLPNNSNVNVLLDESFANTFSNAKHCNTSFSGRKRLVNIYKATTTAFGESYAGDLTTSGFGRGFTSTNIFDVERDM